LVLLVLVRVLGLGEVAKAVEAADRCGVLADFLSGPCLAWEVPIENPAVDAGYLSHGLLAIALCKEPLGRGAPLFKGLDWWWRLGNAKGSLVAAYGPGGDAHPVRDFGDGESLIHELL
jgi:hypothetical protein